MLRLNKRQVKTIVLSIFFSALAAGVISVVVFLSFAGFKDNVLSKYLEKLPFQISVPVAPEAEEEEVAGEVASIPEEPQVVEKKIYVEVEKPDRETMIVLAVETANPAVVSIVATKDVPVYEICYVDPFGDDPFFEGFDVKIPQPCKESTQKQKVGAGSGFIVRSNGLIVTNKHVVADKEAEYTVILSDGSQFTAKILARDPALDFAVLKIEKTGLSTVALGDSSKVKAGQSVIAIGNALGEYQNTISIGIISGLDRRITASGGGITEVLEDVFQTDAAINPGNSGGPLLDLNGKVVGINVAMATGSENIAFALPINSVKASLAQVEKYGEIRRPMIGVRYVPITPQLQTELSLSVDYGAYLTKGPMGEYAIYPGSPAETAGLQENDIILEIDGEKLTSENNLSEIIPNYKVGDTVTLKVLKNSGETMDVQVALIKMP